MIAAFLYPILACALYYLGFWAKITESIWSRYPVRVDAFMRCAACSGFWYGVIVACSMGAVTRWNYLGLPWNHPAALIVSGVVAMMSTPLLAVVHLRALTLLGDASGPPPGGEDAASS